MCALALSLTGCSSDDGDSSTDTTAQSTTSRAPSSDSAGAGTSASAAPTGTSTGASAGATDDATDEAGSAGSQTFEKSKLEDFLSNDVQQKSGVQPDQLACKGDLAVEENATQECAVKTEAGWQKLNVTLIETDTDDPKISWQTEADIIPEPDWVGDVA
ncbi:DUF4333 domain-containing protein [Corynebacterium nuruki]|uniref:DUF4333 domain-containing protein n=1 Tax=Corynebacterium nuruki TaxID=1032851 RepID=UPI002FE372CD